MNDIMRERIVRRLESLPDETGYQVLDYIEFLEARHGTGGREPSTFQKLAERVEDTLRAGRLPVAAVKGTMNVVDAAGRLMRGLAAAGRSAVEQLDTPPEGDGREKKAAPP